MRYELTDYEWATIKPFLPNKPRGITVMGWTAPTLGIRCAMMVVVETSHQGAPSMDKSTASNSVATIGIDLAKKVF